MKNQNIISYNVIIYDPNKRRMAYYDIMPYLVNCYEQVTKAERPNTFEEFKQFIVDESRYQWWSRCEYEIVLTSWPNGLCEEKWDVHKQVMMNLDIITKVFMENINNLQNNGR